MLNSGTWSRRRTWNCVVSLLGLLLSLGHAAVQEPGAEWHITDVGPVGYAEMAELTGELGWVQEGHTGCWLAASDSDTEVLVLYHPSPLNASKPGQGSLVKCHVSLSPNRRSACAGFDSWLIFGSEDGAGALAGPIALSLVSGETERWAWYVHPWTRQFTACGLTSGTVRKREFDDRLPWPAPHHLFSWDRGTGAMDVEGNGDVTHFAFKEQKAPVLHYGRYLWASDRWETEEVGVGKPVAICTDEETIYILAAWHSELRPWNRGLLYQRRLNQAAKGNWTSLMIDDGAFPDEYRARMMPSPRGGMDIIAAGMHYIRRFRKIGDGWEKDYVKAFVPSEEPGGLTISATRTHDGYIHVACHDPHGEKIWHLWETDEGWGEAVVAEAGEVGHTAILEHGGHLMIAWIELNSLRAKLAWRDFERTSMVETKLTLPLTYEWSTLLHAAAHSSPQDVSALLARGVRPDIQGKFGLTPLHAAASREAAQLLLEAGADVNARSDSAKTPLHVIAGNQKVGAMRVVIEHGAPLDVKDDEGRTPLHEAVLHEAPRAAQMLIDYGAEFDILAAAGLDDIERMKEILEANPAAVRRTDGAGYTALHYAVRVGKRRAVEFLAEHGAPLDATEGSHGETSAEVARRFGHPELARMLEECARGEDTARRDEAPKDEQK